MGLLLLAGCFDNSGEPTQTQRNSTAFTLYAHNGDVDTWYDTTLVTNRLNASHESRRFIYIHTYSTIQ
jgi:hypothetical protein